MNKLFSFLLLIFSNLNYAQTEIALGENDKLIYLDSTWAETSKENHRYYRIVKDYNSELKEYKVLEFFKSNQLRKETTLSGKGFGSPNGEETVYYENGKKLSIINYVSGMPTGKSICWYENGNIKEEGEYTGNYEIVGKYYKLIQYWDENNNHQIIDGNGTYSCGDKVDYIETGSYKNGFKDGVFEVKNLKQSSSFVEKYDIGKFISGTRFFADKPKIEYSVMETQPTPKKGMQDFYNFIGKHYRVPIMPRGHKGKVILQFVVEKNGEIVEIKIMRDIGYGTGDEAKRVLLKYANWEPGQQRGLNVRCSYVLPISIESQKKFKIHNS